MKIEKFVRHTHESLILLKCKLPGHEISLALDTGASFTTIDLTALMVAGYNLSASVRSTKIETASGIIDAYVFLVSEFTALGITRKNIEICAYDFFAYHVLTEFDGVLGLDFIEPYKICIDFKKSEISIQ